MAEPKVSIRVCEADPVGRFNFTTAKEMLEKILCAKVEAMSGSEDAVVQSFGFNSFFEALHHAYNCHLELIFRPDDLWLVICQGLATCINQNPEQYRSKFVSHKDKADIIVDRDEFVKGNPNNDWPGCFKEFSAQIRNYIGDATHSLIVADYSTTDPVSLAASEVCLMDCVQSYFNFIVRTRCGIPIVTLLGTPEDWQRLAARTKALSTFEGLDWWLQHVYPIVDEFALAAQGQANLDFWSGLYKFHLSSGGMTADGHLLKLIPYLKPNAKGIRPKNPLIDAEAGAYYRGLQMSNMPQSLCNVPFVWKYLGTDYNYQFIAGHTGVRFDRDSNSVRPVIGWAVKPV